MKEILEKWDDIIEDILREKKSVDFFMMPSILKNPFSTPPATAGIIIPDIDGTSGNSSGYYYSDYINPYGTSDTSYYYTWSGSSY